MIANVMRMPLLAIAAAIGLLAGSAVASAQQQSQQNAAQTAGSGIPGQARTPCQMDQYIDGDLAFLKAELKITDDQAQEWNRFAQAFTGDMKKRATLCREARDQAKEMQSANLLDTISMAEQQLSQRLDSLRAMKAALQPLYASLGKDQKRIADRIMKGGQIF